MLELKSATNRRASLLYTSLTPTTCNNQSPKEFSHYSRLRTKVAEVVGPRVEMSKSSGTAPNATLYELQQPEKLRNVLEQDKQDDCLSCRLIGEWFWTWAVYFMLISNTDGVLRGNGIDWPWCLQLLFRNPSATKATCCHFEKQVKVRHEVKTSWYREHCGYVCRDGILAAGQLAIYDLQLDRANRCRKGRPMRGVDDPATPRKNAREIELDG